MTVEALLYLIGGIFALKAIYFVICLVALDAPDFDYNEEDL